MIFVQFNVDIPIRQSNPKKQPTNPQKTPQKSQKNQTQSSSEYPKKCYNKIKGEGRETMPNKNRRVHLMEIIQEENLKTRYDLVCYCVGCYGEVNPDILHIINQLHAEGFIEE